MRPLAGASTKREASFEQKAGSSTFSPRVSIDQANSMFCSVITPTVGRATLSRAVHSVLDQAFDRDDFEVIVVNDSGRPLPAAEWQDSPRVQVVRTNRRERSIARNTGAALARGRYLCFLDDDDWLLPGALERFWALACQNGDAAWLYGGIRVVDEAGECLAEVNSGLSGNCFAQIVGGAWAPIQASLIRPTCSLPSGVMTRLSAARRIWTFVTAWRCTVPLPILQTRWPACCADEPGILLPITCALQTISEPHGTGCSVSREPSAACGRRPIPAIGMVVSSAST
jgi:hypothetical protein